MDDFIAEQQLFVKTTVKTNKFVYFTWVILGISLVIPWNCFINSTGFILLRLSDNETQWADKEISSNSYQDFWLSAIGITMNIFGAMVLFYNLTFISAKNRILWSYISYALVFCCMLVLLLTAAKIEWLEAFVENRMALIKMFFLVALFDGIAMQIAVGFTNTCLFHLSSCFDVAYIKALMQGTGLSGLFISVLALVPKFIFTKEGKNGVFVEQEKAASLYFLTACATIALCCFLLYKLTKHQVYDSAVQTEAKVGKISMKRHLIESWKAYKDFYLGLFFTFTITFSTEGF